MLRSICLLFFFTVSVCCLAQLKWQNIDSLYQPLPKSIHVYYTDESIDTSKFRAFYVIADLKDKRLNFTTDTTYKRRFTPLQFYQKNEQPLLVVNTTFFSFESNANLSVVIKNGKLVSYDNHVRPLRGKDSLLFAKYLASAIGISRKRKADVTWVYSDSNRKWPIAFEQNPILGKDSIAYVSEFYFAPELHHFPKTEKRRGIDDKWKMQTAVGGGPVLIHNNIIRITNNEELKFAGKAINDKHPRTAMGYTADNKLIILVVEGRNPNAGGATLTQEAQILKDLGCVEALNLDGGGSSCLLINGKETIKPSDKKQRAVPAVFIIQTK
ncbi:MAG: phosphodiester glycosidase family protein [Bacteroidota bacterium]|nr:phosphodiester glycosidase family protein [Bacteroidota bacterium]